MQGEQLLRRLARKGANKEGVAASAIKEPSLVPALFSGLDADKAGVRLGAARVLYLISEKDPAILYPHADSIIDLLDSDNKILKWSAVHMIGNLAQVDTKRKIDRILDRYLEPIPGPELVTAANVIGGAAKIALAKPELTDKIVKAILKAEKGRYRTAECRNVVLGHAIQALDQLFERTTQKQPVARLVKGQLKNRRSGTRKRAERFVKRWLD
jgi:hypothetical protein